MMLLLLLLVVVGMVWVLVLVVLGGWWGWWKGWGWTRRGRGRGGERGKWVGGVGVRGGVCVRGVGGTDSAAATHKAVEEAWVGG